MTKKEISKIMLISFGIILVSGIITILIVYGYTNKYYSEKFDILNVKIDDEKKEAQKNDSIISVIKKYFVTDFLSDNTISVGVNGNLHGNEVSIYNDERVLFLQEGKKFRLQNHRHNYKPSAELLVIDVITRSYDTIPRANIFISKEMAVTLGIDEKQQKKIGVFNMKLLNVVN